MRQRYLLGLQTGLDRKSIEPFALAASTRVRTLQEFLQFFKWSRRWHSWSELIDRCRYLQRRNEASDHARHFIALSYQALWAQGPASVKAQACGGGLFNKGLIDIISETGEAVAR